MAALAIWMPRLRRSWLLRPCFSPRSPSHSSGLRSCHVSKEGAHARHPGTLGQLPWRTQNSTKSGWTPTTCGAERRREGGDGPGQVRSRQHLKFYPIRPIPSHCATSLSWGESPTTPQRHPGARGGDGRGKVRLLRGRKKVHESVASGVRRPVAWCSSAPLDAIVVVIVGRPRRSAASAVQSGTLEVPGRRAVPAQVVRVEGGRHGREEGGRRAGGRDGPWPIPSSRPPSTPERSGSGATSRTAHGTRGGGARGGNNPRQCQGPRPGGSSPQDINCQEGARRRRGHRAAASACP